MLLEVQSSLQRLLYERGMIDPAAVDLRFAAPTREWFSTLTRPTINLFLFDVQENTDLRQANFQTIKGNGYSERRMPPRRFDLRFMVSAITTVVEDEHQLLWRVLVTLLKYSTLPPEVLSETLRSLDPPITTRLSQSDNGPRTTDMWGAFDLPPRPALLYVVTVPVDLNIAFQAPLVLTRTARYSDITRADVTETSTHIGGVVRDKKGRPVAGARVRAENGSGGESVTDADGSFVLRGVPPGLTTLRVSRADGPAKLVKLEVPSESYEITLN